MSGSLRALSIPRPSTEPGSPRLILLVFLLWVGGGTRSHYVALTGTQKAFTCLSLLNAGIKGFTVLNLSSFFLPYSPVVPEDSKFLASEPLLMFP